MKNLVMLALLLSSLASTYTYAHGTGLITNIDVATQYDANHAGIFQVQLEGDFNNGDCNIHFAGVPKEDSHVVALLMSAYMTKTPVTIWLENHGTDNYFADRCVILLVQM